VLAVAAALTGAFERAARHALYGAPIRFVAQSRYQEIVLTGPAGGPPPPRPARPARPAQVPPPRTSADGYPVPVYRLPAATSGPTLPALRMFLGGRLAVCGADEARYHAALVQPALAGPHGRVLILGGGDGLAAAEALAHPDVENVTIVEIDPEVLRLARTDPVLTRLNQHALADPRVQVVTADAFAWLRTAAGKQQPYDVIVADLPDPDLDEGRKLYTEEFYGLVRRMLAPGGRLAVHAGSVADSTYWDADDTLRSTGLRTVEYSVPADRDCDGPADWGFILASAVPPVLRPSTDAAPTPGSLDAPALRLAEALADSRRPVREQSPSTLLHPR
jgi:spermidine synthase